MPWELCINKLSITHNKFNLTQYQNSQKMETKLKIKGNWNELKGKLKQKYAKLTDDDLLFTEGKEYEMLGRLEKRTGKRREEIRKTIEDLQTELARTEKVHH